MILYLVGWSGNATGLTDRNILVRNGSSTRPAFSWYAVRIQNVFLKSWKKVDKNMNINSSWGPDFYRIK